MVIAVPAPVAIEWYQQQLAVGYRFEEIPARLMLRDDLAQICGKPVEDTCAQHEQGHVARKAVDHFGEIGTDRPQRRGQLSHMLTEILFCLGGRGSDDPQYRGPPFGSLVQESELRRVQGAQALVLEKLPRFLEIESQGRRVDLQQLVLRTQCRQWKGRLCSRS
jgi:hypothetical protein